MLMVRDAGTRLQAPKLFLSGRKYNDPICQTILARDLYHMTGPEGERARHLKSLEQSPDLGTVCGAK